MNSEQLAWRIRRHGVEMTHRSGGSHVGSVLSAADLVAVLYGEVLRFDPKLPDWEGRDRLIFSKGHAGAAVYAALAEMGYFPAEELMTHYQDGSRLSGHMSHHLPGVELSTGSLGHGLSVGAGMAYAAKKDGRQHRVFVVLGDGECDEGSVWEAAMFASHFRLSKLVAVVDCNHMQSMDFTENTMELENFAAKWRAFGWNVLETNGHHHAALRASFETARAYETAEPHRPTVILADTVKGKGVSFMQNNVLWHYRYPHAGWEYDLAVAELHKAKPEGAEDPYTPEGIPEPAHPTELEEVCEDYTFTGSWQTAYPEVMRRVEARSGSGERVHGV